MKDTAQSIHEWLTEPFRSNQSAFQWVLFVGLILVGVLAWQLVLLTIFKGVESV